LVIPGAGHIFETDQPGVANQAILEYLAAQRGQAQASAT